MFIFFWKLRNFNSFFEIKRFLHGVRLSEYIDYPNEKKISTAQRVRIIESLLYIYIYQGGIKTLKYTQ